MVYAAAKRRPDKYRPRILMSAYACEPNRGSEPGMGWNWAIQAARFHEVWVLTVSHGKPAIEAALAQHRIKNIHIVYCDVPGWPRKWANQYRFIRLHYVLWHLAVLRAARRIHETVSFDVVHHVSLGTIEIPGLLWMLDAPFILGPVGGAQEPAPAMRRYFGRAWFHEMLRIARKRLMRFNPMIQLAVNHAALILVSNADTRRFLERLGARRIIPEVEVGAAVDPESNLHHTNSDTFTVLWAGLLIPRKAPSLALDAFTKLKKSGVSARLVIAGDGPLKGAIAEQIRNRGLANDVVLLGAVPFAEMSRIYDSADVFLFSSLQDTNGNVLVEALAHGLPVIALDQHGAAGIISEECGIRVPIVNEHQVVTDLAAALERLAANPALRQRMGEAARRRAIERYTWDYKGERLRELYALVQEGEHATNGYRNTIFNWLPILARRFFNAARRPGF